MNVNSLVKIRGQDCTPQQDPDSPYGMMAEAGAPKFSDEALALRFSSRYAHELRYTSGLQAWYVYENGKWHKDDILSVFDRSRRICREASGECNDENVARRVASAATVAAVERLARADSRHAAMLEQWDHDPWILNTPEGIVDLRTGALRSHRSEDYCTKITSAAPGGECPGWLGCLRRVTNGDTQLQAFLQRVSGYCLTGVTWEQALFFLYGSGANGKGVFLSTIAGVLGDYAQTTAVETFTASKTDRHPTELAVLRGARLVTANETEQGRAWAENRIKLITGGDKISARLMRQDFFEYVPQFKLVIAGNHRPSLRTVDEAIRRRLHLIPFTVTIPQNERDVRLFEDLKQEWPGILQWMIDGCLQWQKMGLSAPPVVSAATDQYLEEEDSLGSWVTEYCDCGPAFMAGSSELYASYKRRCITAGEQPLSHKRFAESLASREFMKVRDTRTGRQCFRGLRLRGPEGSEYSR